MEQNFHSFGPGGANFDKVNADGKIAKLPPEL